ncbi:hypothetical protein DFH08DRAFT_812267 [Mycena albidolilacea]|uniref:Uncharacterized protein n=1 Tax=Mycena albidolilacea TaxID=1033008 RepID=A0AAD7EMF7_9AGAR|nr:hypothetical protein DFH08DRAFT_812267 [Mycena albidolilacea]
MAITRNTSARASSPTPSENSDMYYEDFHHTSPSPAPSQTTNVFGWESDSSLSPMESRDATPTPLTARPPSPASVTEISRDEFPPLAVPVPATVTKPCAKTTKANKGKAKAKAAATATAPTSDNDDPFLAADIAAATAASLGLPSQRDDMTEGASMSRRPAADPGSPSKRRRSNTAGDTSPAPAPTIAATHQVATYVTAPIEAPATAPVDAPAAALTVAHAAAPAVPPAAPPVAAPAPVAAPTAAPVAAPAAPAAAPAAALALPPLWLTADALPPRGSYTPTPAGGFPPIVYSPEQLLQGVPADLIRMYKEVSSPKFFLVVSGGNGSVMRTHGLIREAIANYINIDPTTFTLGTPPTAANGSSPTLWLAADIPDPLAQGIVDARILSSTNITLYTLPYNMPVIGFVGVFAGFTLPNTAMGANAAWDLIGTAVQANDEISQFVQTHRDGFGPQVSSGEAWGAFLASITADLTCNDSTFRVVATLNRDSWSQLRRLFGKLQIMTALYGTARLQRAFKCHICPSIDHPTPLCPLPDLPGWLGPTPATIAALEDASRAAASKAQEQMRLNTADGAGGSNAWRGRWARARFL